MHAQARLPEIEALEQQIKATNEELADLQYAAKQDAGAAAAKAASLGAEVARLTTEVLLLP